jgi:hypothetical protein
VSRPIDWCQETSHRPPIDAEVTATAEHHKYQEISVSRFGVYVMGSAAVAIASPRDWKNKQIWVNLYDTHRKD